jgi:hypothetical protein
VCLVDFLDMVENQNPILDENMNSEELNVKVVDKEEICTDDNIFQKIISERINYTKWVALLELYKLICNNEGMIFGGAIRDYIKRKSASNKFNEYFISQKFEKETYKKKYNDKYCNEDTYEDRTLLPNDIDVYISEDAYKKLIDKLEKEYNIFSINSKKNVCYFLETNELFEKALEYKRCYLNFLKSKSVKLINRLLGKNINNEFQIKIDFVVIKNCYKYHKETFDGGLLYPPFGNPDFDINQVGMFVVDGNFEIKVFNSVLRFEINSDYNKQINAQKLIEIKSAIFKEIVNNICNSIAVPILQKIEHIRQIYGDNYQPQLNYKRGLKIANNGYCINGEKLLTKIKHFRIAPDDYVYNIEDKCIVCFNNFTNEKKWFNFGCQCNVKIHLECYVKYIRYATIDEFNNILCPHCRTPNKFECPCIMMNFMSSISHLFGIINNNKECKECIKNNYNVQCLKWYYPCKVCNS